MRPPPIGGGFTGISGGTVCPLSYFNEAAADWRRILETVRNKIVNLVQLQ